MHGYKRCPRCGTNIPQYWYNHERCGWNCDSSRIDMYNLGVKDSEMEEWVGK